MVKGVLDVLGIERSDEAGRAEVYLRIARCFGAPHMIYLHLAEGFNHYALLDAGLILQTIALLALEKGLGTCFLAMAVLYPQTIRKHCNILHDRKIVMGLAVGYPDAQHLSNKFISERGSLDDFVVWVEE
jgi:nitroreductase